MKVLITGSHGFVGTNLIEALSGEHEIVRWDVRLDNALPPCDAVIHLAGLAHDTRHVTEQEWYFRVNTELTKKLYDRFLGSSARKFIFFSSIKAQDNDTPYAKSKSAAETAILENEEFLDELSDKAERRIKRQKEVYILRPCMIHGKGVKGNLPLLFNVVKKGWPWPLAAFENQRSYASMGNVSFVVRQLLAQDVASGIYNLCDDEAVSTNELVTLIGAGLGKKVPLWRVPEGIVNFGAKVGDVLHLPLNSERLRKLTENRVVDNSKIKEALGIECMPVRALDGLKATIMEMIKK